MWPLLIKMWTQTSRSGIIFLIFVFVKCYGLQKHKVSMEEGQDAIFKYASPTAVCEYALHFVDKNKTSHLMTPEYSFAREQRFTWMSEKVFDKLLVSLTIKNLKPSDEGKYRASFQCDGKGQFFQEYRVRVVQYSQIIPSCSWIEDGHPHFQHHENSSFPVLACSPVGRSYPHDSLVCHSDDDDATHLHSPVQVSEGIAFFLLDKNKDVACCSSRILHTQNGLRVVCKDFFKSSNNSHFASITGEESEPCPTANDDLSPVTQGPVSSSVTSSVGVSIENDLIAGILFISGIAIIVILVVLLLFCNPKKTNKSNKNTSV